MSEKNVEPWTKQNAEFTDGDARRACDGAVESHHPTGELIDLLRENGFSIERLLELQAPADAETHGYYDYVTAEWARSRPSEEIWVARKTG